MASAASPADVFARALGADRVDTDLAPRFEVDGVRPACVLKPRSQEEVARALQTATETGLAVIPFGRGTMRSMGNIPSKYDAALDLTLLRRVVEYAPEDLTATVEAGLSLADLNALLAERGQCLPFDPPDAEGATIGGIVAANATGPLRHAYDAPRDRLIGVTVALPDGRLAKAGGRVVKNVAGYDLCKLYCGSMGTLGVIVSLTFKLAPLPRAEATWGAPFSSPALALAAGFGALERRLALRALEIVSPAAASAAGLASAWWLLARCAGGAAAVGRSLRELGQITAGDVLDGTSLWDRLATIARDKPVIVRVSTRATDLVQALSPLSEGAMVTATLAHGVARVGLDADDVALRRHVERLGGAWVLERAPLEVKRALDVWGPLPAAFEIMRRLKREFDPFGTLSPGRFVGRL